MVRSLGLFLLLLPLTFYGQYVFPLVDSLDRFTAEVVMAECSNGVCNGAGYVKIGDKHGNVFLQTIHFRDQVVLYPATMQLKEGEPAEGFEQVPLRFVDFDFDGYSDLLLAARETLLFYRYRQDLKKFMLQPLHKRLKRKAISGAVVDTATKRLLVFYTAADRDVREEYEWESGKPQPVFSLSIRERTVGFVTGDNRIQMPFPPDRKQKEETRRTGNEFGKGYTDKDQKAATVLIVVKEEKTSGRWKRTSRRFTPEEYKRPENSEWRR